jgi:hypothetical protein
VEGPAFQAIPSLRSLRTYTRNFRLGRLAGPYTSKMVSNAQLCVTVAIPSFLILVGIFVNLLTTSRLRADIRGEPVSVRSEIASLLPTLFGVVRTEMHAVRTELRREFALLQARVTCVKEKRS